MKIVIVGGSFGGISCAREARRLYPQAEILLIEKKAQIGFIPSGMLLYIEGRIDSLADAFFCKADQLRAEGIIVALNEAVLGIAPDEHLLHTDRRTIQYDRLVLAAGSSQDSHILPQPEESLLTYKEYDVAQSFVDQLAQADSVGIVGAGQAGMEAANTMITINKSVSVIESMDYPLFKYFDQTFLQPFLDELAQIPNLTFYWSEPTLAVNKTDTGFQIETAEHVIESDLVLTTVNVHPSVQSAFASFRRHSDQTIWTDAYLETSQRDVFAVGDLIQIPNGVTNDTTYMPLVNNAIRSGAAAARNLLEKTLSFRGGLRTVGTQLFGWYLASTGLTESDRFFYEKEVVCHDFEERHSVFAPDKIYGKLTIEAESGRILGAQLLSKANILEKINLLAFAIEKKSTLDELAQKDFFFQPKFSPATDQTFIWPVGCDADET
ncbi:FAD-dependent oxidoreductase [Enterococcus sp. DIV0876]|uniref:FAD-dependent oxidoreductase n=1 Tax=Enterococcus sp. DIV0876 TaxID=2774633 RepID=UPI003D2FE181